MCLSVELFQNFLINEVTVQSDIQVLSICCHFSCKRIWTLHCFFRAGMFTKPLHFDQEKMIMQGTLLLYYFLMWKLCCFIWSLKTKANCFFIRSVKTLIVLLSLFKWTNPVLVCLPLHFDYGGKWNPLQIPYGQRHRQRYIFTIYQSHASRFSALYYIASLLEMVEDLLEEGQRRLLRLLRLGFVIPGHGSP